MTFLSKLLNTTTSVAKATVNSIGEARAELKIVADKARSPEGRALRNEVNAYDYKKDREEFQELMASL